jgi:hypothetical protein
MEEKVSLPTKTKIAAWWIKITGIIISVIGIINLIGGFLAFITPAGPMAEEEELLLIKLSFLIFLIGGFILFLGFQLEKKKKWAYVEFFLLYIFLLGLNFLLSIKVEKIITEYFFIELLLYFLLIPLILLLLDCKNFWKVAR